MESWAVTAPSLVYTSFETVAKALSDTTREKELILPPLIFLFCSVFVLTRARTVFLGVTEGLSLCLFLLSPPWIMVFLHLNRLAASRVLFAEFGQRHLRLV